jgi:PAS domain-containing protein
MGYTSFSSEDVGDGYGDGIMAKCNPRWWSTPPVSLTYGFAVLSVTVALTITWWMEILLQAAAPVSLLLCAVMFSAWFGGIKPALPSIALAVLVFDYYALPDDLHGAYQELKRINQALRAENSERQRADEALRAGEQNSRLIVNSIPGHVWTGTPAGEVESVNQPVTEYTGKALAELKGWSTVVHRDDLGPVSSAWNHTVQSGEPLGKRFIKIVAIAPYLGLKDPATRPNNAGGWVKPYTARLLGLKMLNGVGFHAFVGLPVAAFALPKDIDPARGTPTWSYRMVENCNTRGGPSLFTPRDTWRDDIRGADTRLAVLFGADDPGIDPAKARAEFAVTAPEVPVVIVPNADRVGLVQGPPAIARILAVTLNP